MATTTRNITPAAAITPPTAAIRHHHDTLHECVRVSRVPQSGRRKGVVHGIRPPGVKEAVQML